jgi:hypothetical protein
LSTAQQPQPPQQPKLQVLLDSLDSAVQQLRVASDEYAEIKAIYQHVHAHGTLPEGCELSLVVPPGRALAIPALADQDAILAALNGALATGGGQVTALWRKIHDEITGPAVQHCDAAVARAAAVANQNMNQ